LPGSVGGYPAGLNEDQAVQYAEHDVLNTSDDEAARWRVMTFIVGGAVALLLPLLLTSVRPVRSRLQRVDMFTMDGPNTPGKPVIPRTTSLGLWLTLTLGVVVATLAADLVLQFLQTNEFLVTSLRPIDTQTRAFTHTLVADVWQPSSLAADLCPHVTVTPDATFAASASVTQVAVTRGTAGGGGGGGGGAQWHGCRVTLVCGDTCVGGQSLTHRLSGPWDARAVEWNMSAYSATRTSSVTGSITVDATVVTVELTSVPVTFNDAPDGFDLLPTAISTQAASALRVPGVSRMNVEIHVARAEYFVAVEVQKKLTEVQLVSTILGLAAGAAGAARVAFKVLSRLCRKKPARADAEPGSLTKEPGDEDDAAASGGEHATASTFIQNPMMRSGATTGRAEDGV
jgi:hypothetical protein